LAASHYYVDAAYCYRRSSVVSLTVGQSVTIMSPAKTAEPMEMPFGIWIQVGPRNRVLDGSRSSMPRGNFEGERYVHGKYGWLKEQDQ